MLNSHCATGTVGALVILLLTEPAVAEIADTPRPPPNEAGFHRDERSRWQQHWPDFSWLEGVLTLTAGGATAGLFLAGPASEPRWRGGILFDDAVRGGLRAKSEATRARFRTIGDATYYAAPALVMLDALVLPLAVYGDSVGARNMTLVAVEAFSYSGLTSFLTTSVSARERPDSGDCKGRSCVADTESFLSGHSAIAATSAGLICAHHAYLPLDGYAALDVAACALASTNALVTATTRVVADRHYATDVLAGLSLGFVVGYAVPVLLHFNCKLPKIAFNLRADGDEAMLHLGWRL